MFNIKKDVRMAKRQAGILLIHLNSWKYVWGKEHINQNLSTSYNIQANLTGLKF